MIEHTLFDLIKQSIPQKSTTKTGLLIEPHYLERAKFQRFHPSQSNHSYDGTIQEVTASFHKNTNISQKIKKILVNDFVDVFIDNTGDSKILQ